MPCSGNHGGVLPEPLLTITFASHSLCNFLVALQRAAELRKHVPRKRDRAAAAPQCMLAIEADHVESATQREAAEGQRALVEKR